MNRSLHPPERPGTQCTGGWLGWSGWVQKFSPPTRIPTPGHPAHSESLHQLKYPGPPYHIVLYVFYHHHAAIVLKIVSCVKAAFMSTEHLVTAAIRWSTPGILVKFKQMFQNSDEVCLGNR